MNNDASAETPPPQDDGGSVPERHAVVVRFGRLGDMVMLDPLLRLLHHRYGRPCWLIGSGPWSRQLYGRHAHVDRVISLSGGHTPLLLGAGWWRALWALRRSTGSPIYVCETRPLQCQRVSLALRLAGVPAHHCLFQDLVRRPNEHHIDVLLRLGQRTPRGMRVPLRSMALRNAPALEPSERALAYALRWLSAHDGLQRPLVLLQPGNRHAMRRGGAANDANSKYWPIAHWAQLARCILTSQPQALLVLCGARREQRLLHSIRAAAGGDAITLLRSTPTRLLGLCARAHSMVSVDTGPAHLAAAVGVPLVVLFGGASPQYFTPRSALGTPVRSLGGPPSSRHVRDIPVRAVYEAWQSLYREPGATAQAE